MDYSNGLLLRARQTSQLLQIVLNVHCEWVRATHHAPRNTCSVLECRQGLAEIVARGAVGQAERSRVRRSTAPMAPRSKISARPWERSRRRGGPRGA
jgi:hypothetical protein